MAGTEVSRPGGEGAMSLAIAVAVFPVIFVAELPDKSMFASLVLASRGRPLAVWLGAAAGFTIHIAIATTVGVAVFRLLPARLVDALVAMMFLGGAIYAFREATHDETALVAHEAATHRRVATTAFAVIFVAEWGDLTQILTANLAAHYQSGLSVAVGATAALWCVAALAVVGGQGLLRFVPVTVVRRVTGVVLLVLATIAAWSAIPH
jgi:putative Ca2+/H+ antiporter (TMEM165/GDT1 family)